MHMRPTSHLMLMQKYYWNFISYIERQSNIMVKICKYSTPPLLCNSGFCPFSMWNLDQIWHPMAVLKSAHCDDSKTPPTCLNWWSFGWDIWGWRKLKFLKNWFCLHLFQCQLSQSIRQQIQRSGTYLKSACHEDSKTVIDCWNWWRIDWDIQG